MASLYTQQSRNVFRTWMLMSVFFALVIAIGFFIAQYYGDPVFLWVAVAFSIGMNITAYWFSDRIALHSAHAKPADGTEFLELNRIVENLAITAGLPKPRVYIIEDAAPNAFAAGRDPKHAVVAVTTGLLATLERSELEGVIAHELSHIGNRDILVMTVAVVLAGFLSVIADLFLRVNVFHGGGERDRNANPVILIVGIAGIILAPIAAQLIQLAISRKREFLADASGALLTRYPDALASALRKISAYQVPMRHATSATAHLYISNPFGAKAGQFVTRLFSTHPPVQERIDALLSMRSQ